MSEVKTKSAYLNVEEREIVPINGILALLADLAMIALSVLLFVFPWALGIVAKIFGKGNNDPMFVSVDGYAILFIALNALVMGGIIVGLKFLIRYIERKMENKRGNA